jgi:hypothetical protein
MTKLVCLANSRKYHNRCIAGLTPDGVWVRPVSRLPDGSIPWNLRAIDGREPQLLEVLTIPLAERGPEPGHQPENRLVEAGPWVRLGAVAAERLIRFCSAGGPLLHTPTDRVPTELLARLPAPLRRSLELIAVNDARYYSKHVAEGHSVRVAFTFAGASYDLAVTDPLAEVRIFAGQAIRPQCLLTVSMAFEAWEGSHFKFVAAVIETAVESGQQRR